MSQVTVPVLRDETCGCGSPLIIAAWFAATWPALSRASEVVHLRCCGRRRHVPGRLARGKWLHGPRICRETQDWGKERPPEICPWGGPLWTSIEQNDADRELPCCWVSLVDQARCAGNADWLRLMAPLVPTSLRRPKTCSPSSAETCTPRREAVDAVGRQSYTVQPRSLFSLVVETLVR